MTYSVYQHWDPLQVCVVGRSYPPEFYNWIKVPHVRRLFETIAEETEQDYQNIIAKLESFGVTVLRPDLPEENFVISGKYEAPPMNPRDVTVMIGDTFYNNYGWGQAEFATIYNDIKDPSWPECRSLHGFLELPDHIRDECEHIHELSKHLQWRERDVKHQCYDKIFQHVQAQGNQIKHGVDPNINGAMVSRIGRDLYFGTATYRQDQTELKNLLDGEFVHTRNHIVDTGGHSDGTYCPVCPGLIISLHDVPTYAQTFPDWEVVYLPYQSWDKVKDFLSLKMRNHGKWWIPGFEHDTNVVNVVETWLDHWTGYVEETVFDVNMLVVDPKNVLVFNHNDQVFDAFARHGITPHVVPFRHRYFWDGGIHCLTSDLHRQGHMQDFFPGRSQ
jgi:hypothetical protein